MSRWIDASEQGRRYLVNAVSSEKNIHPESVEKDWWVTEVLKSLFKMSCADYLLFKGGTSLSKGWNLINRFSEDIDIALNRTYYKDVKGFEFAECRNNNQVKNLRKANRDYVLGDFSEELESILDAEGLTGYQIEKIETRNTSDGLQLIDHDKDPACLLVQYPTLFSGGTGYLRPAVKIEISSLSMREPFENKHISSMIAEKFPDLDTETFADINAVSPARTFLEKAFLLNEEMQREFPRTRRMSRHLYDLEHLMDSSYGISALNDLNLYISIVEHRKKFYHVGGIDYSSDMPDKIRIVPEGELLDRFRSDYVSMSESMIFGDKLDFDYLIERLKALQERFRRL